MVIRNRCGDLGKTVVGSMYRGQAIIRRTCVALTGGNAVFCLAGGGDFALTGVCGAVESGAVEDRPQRTSGANAAGEMLVGWNRRDGLIDCRGSATGRAAGINPIAQEASCP